MYILYKYKKSINTARPMFSEPVVAECGYENDSGPTAPDNAYPGHLCYWRFPSPSEQWEGASFRFFKPQYSALNQTFVQR